MSEKQLFEVFSPKSCEVAAVPTILKMAIISKYWCWILFRYFWDMVIIFSSPPFYTNHVQLPIGTDPVPPKIANNPKFFPYFKDAVGAIDGSHLHVAPPMHWRPFYQDCKGSISMNCLFACPFALKFIYALTGWEGSAAHGLLWHDALKKGLVIPNGKYLLADAGFSANPNLLIPHYGVRYHLEEWGVCYNPTSWSWSAWTQAQVLGQVLSLKDLWVIEGSSVYTKDKRALIVAQRTCDNEVLDYVST